MRRVLVCHAGVAMLAACSKAPAPAANAAAPANAAPATPAAPTAPVAVSGAAVSGSYTVDGKPAALSVVTTHTDDPFDGKPIVDIIFTEKDPAGDADPATDAVFGNFGDAIVAKVEPDGTVVGADIVHTALNNHGASVSLSGVLTMQDYKVAGGQISGHLTSDGPTDVFGQKVAIDLTFHAKAP